MKTLRHIFSRSVCLLKPVLPKNGLERHLLSTIIPPILLSVVLYTLQHTSSAVLWEIQPKLIPRNHEGGCKFDSTLPETCQLVRERCSDFDDDGLIPYLRLYYCAPPAVRPVALAGMFLWSLILFAAMAAAAGDYLSVNLSVIVSTLGLSESLAGVTIFAFGNGSSDLFSTLAAMNANSGGLAITELFGAAAFINTIVFGLVATTQPFSVDPSVFVGEVVWFILLASCLVAFLADGQLQLGECLGIIGLYTAFVVYVLLRPNSSEPRPEPEPEPGSAAAPDMDSNSSEVYTGEEPSETTRLLDSHDRDGSNISGPVHTSKSALVVSSFREAIIKIFPGVYTWSTQSINERALTLFSMPLLLPIGLTTPVDLEKVDRLPQDTERSTVSSNATDEASEELSATTILDTTRVTTRTVQDQTKSLARACVLSAQFVFGAQLLACVFVSQSSIVEATSHHFGLAAAWALPLSGLLIVLHVMAHRSSSIRLATINHLLNATWAFIISLTWIYLAATTIVTLLKTIGFILNIPEAVLGATIFAIGNSSNDLVANTAVAKRGFPILAASACIGGPMMNMLLGIGIGGLVQVLKADSNGVYSFEVSAGLLTSAANLLIALFVILLYAFTNSWKIDTRLALFLMGIWSVFTMINVGLSTV